MNNLTPLFLVLGTTFTHSILFAENFHLSLWISSFQDQSYYEQMADLYVEKTGKEVNLQVEAYGFREMPDKLGAVMQTGEGGPDFVQLDETFLEFFLMDNHPFLI